MLGKIICDLAPKKNNPRNSEGAFIELKSGRIMFAYTHYLGDDGDDGAPAEIRVFYLSSDGETVGKEHKIEGLVPDNVDFQNLMSVSLVRTRSGRIAMIYLVKHRSYNCTPYIVFSDDEGASWSCPKRIIEENGYFVLNNDRVITLKDGRLLLAVAHTPFELSPEADGTTWKKGVKGLPADVWVYASSDEGDSWSKISEVPYIYSDRQYFTCGWQEPGLIQLNDGTVRMLIRTELGRIYDCFSSDGGKSWTTPAPCEFTAPISPICMKRLSSGKTVYVWNPVPLYNGKSQDVDGVWTGARNPLAITALSDGERLRKISEVDRDEKRGFAYTAIHELCSGSLLLGYCAGGVEDKGMLNRLRIRKISKNEVELL